MDFSWSEENVAYRMKVRSVIARELPEDWAEIYEKGLGSPEQIDYSRKFCPVLAREGLLLPHWPREYGGQGSDAWKQLVLAEEMWTVGEPRGPQYMGVNWLGPTLMRYGTDAQKAFHLNAIASGNVVWSQGFSEPQAGTDLAALKTKATREGDHYRIDGMKVWTSYAPFADYIFLLARTGPERKAISVFLVPMNLPGISVVPFPGLPEEGHLNEVFFQDVMVPETALLGQESQGWEVITYALGFERVGIPRYHYGRIVLDRAVEQLKAEGRFDDPLVRAAAARIVAKLEANRLLTYVVVDHRIHDTPVVAEPSIARITAAEACKDLMDFLMEYLPGCLTGENNYLGLFYQNHIPAFIAAGTYELQLDLIAQRGLGLPRFKAAAG